MDTLYLVHLVFGIFACFAPCPILYYNQEYDKSNFSILWKSHPENDAWFLFCNFGIHSNINIIYRLAKLKGISTEKPDPPSDSSDEDEDGTTKPSNPPPPPPVRMVKSPPPSVKSPPPGKRKSSSIMSPTKSQKSIPPEEEKWIDYRGKSLVSDINVARKCWPLPYY